MKQLYRMIPKVDILLESPECRLLEKQYGKAVLTEEIRLETERLREFIKERMAQSENMEAAIGGEAGSSEKADAFRQETMQEFSVLVENMTKRVAAELESKEGRGFCRVINATGTILHTNLGRAPISRAHAEEMMDLVTGYSNLEYNLDQGKRGERYSHFEKLICRITGAEAAMAVNNNAAAVLLVLSALGCGKEVIVSRGEQIEIGGKFRIPDVIRQGGAILREVGCTNKTHIDDYEEALNENTGILLKVHTSNYRVIGFSESVSTREMAELAHERGVYFVEDLGSGFVVDLSRYGINNEPTVQEVVAAGADVVCFSGDKLLGGPQAGIIVGKKECINRIKKHPLTRALRIDKFTAAALYLVWKDYNLLKGKELTDSIPSLQLMTKTKEELLSQAEELAKALRPAAGDRFKITVSEMPSQMGGGTLPLYQFEGAGIIITPVGENAPHVTKLEEKLRRLPVPVVGRIQEGRLELHMRTILPEDMKTLIDEAEELFR